MNAIDFEQLPAYKSRHFNYGKAPHRLLTYWYKGHPHTITVGGPLYTTDGSLLHGPYQGLPAVTAQIGASLVKANRASVAAPVLAAIDALSGFDAAQARIVPPDNYHVILTPASLQDAQLATPWPDTEVRFDASLIRQNIGKDGFFDAEINHDAYFAIRDQLQRNRAQNVYTIDGNPFHLELNSSYHANGWKLIDAGLVERY